MSEIGSPEMRSVAKVNRTTGLLWHETHDIDPAPTWSFAVARPLAESHDNRALTAVCVGMPFGLSPTMPYRRLTPAAGKVSTN